MPGFHTTFPDRGRINDSLSSAGASVQCVIIGDTYSAGKICMNIEHRNRDDTMICFPLIHTFPLKTS